MPTARKPRRPRRTFRRRPRTARRLPVRRISRRSGFGVGRPNLVFPAQMFRKLTYSSGTTTLAQSVTGVPYSVQFSGNSLYDPDRTGGGHQPRWFDTLCGNSGGTAPYYRYCAVASKIKVTIWQDVSATATNAPCRVSVIPSVFNSGGEPADLPQMEERLWAKSVGVGNSNSSAPLVITNYAKTKQMWVGHSTDPDFGAVYNSDPSKTWYWYVSVCNIVPGGLSRCYVDIKVVYYTRFYNLSNVATS